MEKYFDATVSLSPDIAVYQGDPKIEFEQVSSIKKGKPFNLLRFNLSSHSGTHIDAPFHFFQLGKSVDEILPEVLFGPARVVTVRGRPSISRKILESINLDGITRVLFKTDHSYLLDRYTRFRSSYVYLEVDACGYLVGKGIRLVGIDSFSIEKHGSSDYMCHKVLLGAGVVILEMVNLKDIDDGDYEMFCLPLKIHKGDGAPARVILRTSNYNE